MSVCGDVFGSAPSDAVFLGLSLANTFDMISSQACHWFMGAAVKWLNGPAAALQPLNARARSCATIEGPRPKCVGSPKSQRT
jgi:hypothetical protein